ncbi:sugar-binding protein [Phytoactinopolyspora halotolerans]|uniref:GlcNAc-PI de-N-acetylase n=1 Tax=Phytoactinopolyspora halotolerans TaxID=1981512 RepID=A0A6L9SIT5_9ACTN|nr:sugar-binding protein [Phytoactinopolyspora halotolerans]NEE04322.1 GlcNAc-PI de-N-acetylase [Phytoactinopolyspora halotolerans]
MRLSKRLAAIPAAALLVSPLAAASVAAAGPNGDSAGKAADGTVDLDVLYVGAHPDDEAGLLATFGQWKEFDDLKAGVITVTRGEGGGNAVGLEEGPELGILREAEERRAVGYAGIENIYNLDKVDLFYTLSAPLHRDAWDAEAADDTLARVVRTVRATKPEVIVTMNPSPTPGNHGGHQEAARLAVEAYQAAADPDAFPEQIDDEGLEPWAVGRILQGGASGSGITGSACETTPYEPRDPSARVFGTWQGRTSEEAGETWALLERRAQWEYASQGWAGFPPPPDDPEQIGCDWLTLIDSRTPHPDPASGPTAAVQGAALPIDGGLPLGTELAIEPSSFTFLPGVSFEATVEVKAADRPLLRPRVELDVPDGWTVDEVGALPTAIRPGDEVTVDAVITPADDAEIGGRFNIGATVTTRDGASGRNAAAVEAVNEVHGRLSAREEIADFNSWTHEQNLPKLETLIAQTTSVGTGRSQEVTVDVTNDGDDVASGAVALDLADGFAAEPAEQPFDDLAPGESTSVTFEVTNTDTSLPTSSNADGGGYPFQILTTVGSTTDVQDALLELVPTSEVPQLEEAPTLDGVADDGEYPGEVLDASTHWEGQRTSADDVSATAQVSFTDDALYVFVDVTDDVLGTKLTPEDCKRHWRTDSVELTIDPRGTSENASTAFKTGIFPITDDPDNGDAPCYERDADNHQGPGDITAPGMEVASVVRGVRGTAHTAGCGSCGCAACTGAAVEVDPADEYTGYTLEVKIPFEDLPDNVDPDRMGFDVLIYDSDTQDKTGQTRLGWSTFGGVQANPNAWGLLTLPGLADAGPDPQEPILPSEAALSVNSPQSIAQSAMDGVPLGSGPGLGSKALSVTSASLSGDAATVQLRTRAAGQANVFIWDGENVVGSVNGADVGKGKTTLDVPVELGDDVGDELQALIAFMNDDGTAAAAEPLG